MTRNVLKLITVSTLLSVGTMNFARADCESDLTLLEQAMANPNLTPEAKAALDAAGAAGAAAMKKDDDAACNKAVMTGLSVAGLTPAASPATASTVPLGDLSPFKVIAIDTLQIVKTGDMVAAKSKIKELEMAWDKSAKALKAANLDKWNVIDKSIDTVLKKVRAANPSASASADALAGLIAAIDKTT